MSSAPTAAHGLYRPALVASALLGLAGAGVGGYLTALKFRATYTPCLGPCPPGALRCEDPLSAAWSTVAGLPVSAWATAAYVGVAALAVGLLVRPQLLGGCAAALLGLLSLAIAVVSLAYAAYALAIAQPSCAPCLSLYVVAALLLACAAAVTRSADPRAQSGLRVTVRHRRASLLEASFRVAMLLTIVGGAQSVAYHGARRLVTARDGCPEQAEPPPPATIRFGPADAPVILAAYLDMSCSACKRKFKQLAAALRAGQFPHAAELRIYHAPRYACEPAAFPAGYSRSDERARDDNACLAARAVECAEKLEPGAGYRLVGGLFALHDDRQPGLPLFTAERVGDRAADLGVEIDPDDPDNPLFGCIDHDRGVLATITAHQRRAEALGVAVPAIAVHAAKDGEIDPTRPAYWVSGETPLDDLALYIDLQADPPAPAK
jgi:uncharacterized membrane protein